MTRRTYGILVGVVGSAVGAWWWMRPRRGAARESDRGTLIFDNTPTASALSEGVI